MKLEFAQIQKRRLTLSLASNRMLKLITPIINKMNLKNITICFCSSLFFGSCIQSEALNSEAAIDGCTGKNVQLVNINATAKNIEIYVSKTTNLSQQELNFTLPFGATLKANNPSSKDNPPYYDFSGLTRWVTVVSENGRFQSTYRINAILPIDLPYVFHFEDLAEETPYHTLYIDKETSELTWASGNPGYKLTAVAKIPDDYPTVQTGNGYKDKCIKLETRTTGPFGAMAKMYIAAGNLFIGTFDLSNALKDARKATNFGFQFYKRPKTLKGYYKYKAGPEYTDNGKPQSGVKDHGDIYAIMYEADDVSFMLNGENALTSDKLVSVARVKPGALTEGEDWKTFDIPFEPVNGKTIDDEKLKNGKYKLSIVLSSSIDGAYFKGAVGSTLYIDELELICGN